MSRPGASTRYERGAVEVADHTLARPGAPHRHRPIRTVVNTHPNRDHCDGNQLVAGPGVDGIEPPSASVEFHGTHRIDAGGRTVELSEFGPSFVTPDVLTVFRASAPGQSATGSGSTSSGAWSSSGST